MGAWVMHAATAAENKMAVFLNNWAQPTDRPENPNEPNGNSRGWDHNGDVLMDTPLDGREGLYLANVDLAKLRASRATARGHALTHPAPMLEICGLYRHTTQWKTTNVFDRIAAAYI